MNQAKAEASDPGIKRLLNQAVNLIEENAWEW
jgi:hypothetical protein